MVSHNRRNAALNGESLGVFLAAIARQCRIAPTVVRTDYPRKLTESVAELLQKILTSQ